MRSGTREDGIEVASRFTLPLLLITAVLAIPYHLRPENFVVDDGYFYLVIARNIVIGRGSTFNGWLPTNGYHPLWMLVCCTCALVVRSTEPLLQLVSAVQDALLVLSLWIFLRVCRGTQMLSLCMGATIFWFMGDVLGIWRLLETYLAVCLQLLVLLIVVYRPSKRSYLQQFGVGLLLGLTLLARLDLLFFVGTVLIWQMLQEQQEHNKRFGIVALQVAGVCCLVLPYLAWNLHQFGHMVPVSGAIKSSFPHWHGQQHLTPDVFLIASGTLLNLSLLWRRSRNGMENVALASAVASAVYLVYALSFTAVWPWYLSTGTITVACAGVRMCEAILKRFAWPTWTQPAAAAALVLALFLPALLRSRTNLSMTRALVSHTISLRAGGQEPRRRLALELRDRLPTSARIFTFDTPGSLAYYSGLSITPADGLVCDYGYSADLLRDGFSNYTKQHGMRYMVLPVLTEGQTYDWLETAGTRQGTEQKMQVFAPMKHRAAGGITLRDDDLLFQMPTIQPGFERTMPRVGVWRLDAK